MNFHFFVLRVFQPTSSIIIALSSNLLPSLLPRRFGPPPQGQRAPTPTLFGRRFLFCAQHLTPFPEGFEARCSEYAQSIATARFRLPPRRVRGTIQVTPPCP